MISTCEFALIMDSDLRDRFCDLVLSQGSDVLDDGRRLRALLSDVFPDRPGVRMGLFTAVSDGMVGRLRRAVQNDQLLSETAVLRVRLHDEFGLNEGLSNWVLVTLCAALGIDLPVSSGQSSASAPRRLGTGGSNGSFDAVGAYGIATEHWLEGTPGKAGSVFREGPDFPEMVVIPAGSFVMGSPKSEKGRKENESPQRRVTFAQPFALGRYPVTFVEWDAAVARDGNLHRPADEHWGRMMRPVIYVSWQDARDFAAELNNYVSRNPYRLPSEAEWEYAARGGTTTPFWTGETISTDQANYNGDYVYGSGRKGINREFTTLVGAVGEANPFGLYDVHGNVWEWVGDVYASVYSGAPVDGSARLSPDSGQRVLRGGSWGVDPRVLRSANRFRFGPDIRSRFIGFRIARTLAL